MTCFDSERYLSVQIQEIRTRLAQRPNGGSGYIEFGGKTYDDQHAARVLPGYDPNLKLRLLKELTTNFEVAVAVSARDILKPRIRGDSQLFYDQEAIRVIQNLRIGGVEVKFGILSMVRQDYASEDTDRLDSFRESARSQLEIAFIKHGFIQGYPGPEIYDQASVFSRSPKLQGQSTNILVLSPGGGSGKFGVCLSQLFHDFRAGRNSIYMKFETFPVFDRPTNHPLNLAFMAATADLGNIVVEEVAGGQTSYDKDMENFVLLKVLIERFCPDAGENPMSSFLLPSDMSVNKITRGFLDEDGIKISAVQEIGRRIKRYRDEVRRSIEREETIRHLERNLPPNLRPLID